jgi:hypothetical protein
MVDCFSTNVILDYLKVVAAASLSEGYQTCAVEKYAALALEERTAASEHKKQ